MVTTVFWVSGYWRTSISPKARSPSTKISRLTTLARTGLWMKMSVNFISVGLARRRCLLLRRLWPVSGPDSVLVSASSTMTTSTPLRSFTWPAETTRSPTLSPSSTST